MWYSCTSIFEALSHGNIKNETKQKQQRKKVRRAKCIWEKVQRARERRPDDLAITIGLTVPPGWLLHEAVDELPT